MGYTKRMFPEANNLPGIELGPGVWTDRDQLHFGFSRSSGPGGQNVNKVNTKTELRVNIESLHGMSDRARGRLTTLLGSRLTQSREIVITADGERTQESNRRACLGKLRDFITKALVEPKIRRKTKPSRGAKQRRLEGKKRVSEKKRNRTARFE
jgi:ribosome-associated protein